MSSFLQALSAASKSSEVKRNNFLASFDPNGNTIGIFLEGRDDPSLIRVHAEQLARSKNLSVKMMVLGNKKEVIDNWKYFEARFPDNPRLCFFVDKDHDNLLGETEGIITQGSLFVTKCYSIENYLVKTETIKAVLSDLWGIDSPEIIQAACNDFQKFQQAYHSVFLPLMTWWLAAQRAKQKVNKNNLKFSILEVDSDFNLTLNWNPDIDMNKHLIRQCNVSNPPDQTAINLATQELQSLPTKTWLRGKQEIWCLVAFLNRLEQNAKNKGFNLKIRSKIVCANAVELLAPRIACPQDLLNYLTTRFNII